MDHEKLLLDILNNLKKAPNRKYTEKYIILKKGLVKKLVKDILNETETRDLPQAKKKLKSIQD